MKESSPTQSLFLSLFRVTFSQSKSFRLNAAKAKATACLSKKSISNQ